MGLQIGEIVPKKEVLIKELKGQIIAVDAFNIIYQFLSSIRQPDGTPLQDSKGRVTSHLSGLFYRNISLLSEGLKLVYVFDGVAPDMKKATWAKRKEVKNVAEEKYETAKDEEDIEEMGKYARQLSVLDKPKIEESKRLLKAMGIPVIQAPGEGEAQASYICQQGDAYAVASQDYDCLMFNSPKLIQNLTLAKKRKTRGGVVDVTPMMINLKEVLSELEINQEQLIAIGVLSGTDYNPGGVHGIGQKKALKLIKELGKLENVVDKLKADGKEINFNWQEVEKEIKEPNVNKNYKIEFGKFDFNAVKEIMKEYEFNEERINAQFEKLEVLEEQKKQKTLF